jgi:hypothetical protein
VPPTSFFEDVLFDLGSNRAGRYGALVLDREALRNAQTLGMNLEEQVADGTIHILFESPQELDIDSHYARIIQLVEEHDVQTDGD